MRYSIITFLLLLSISSFTEILATCGSCPPTTIPKLPIPNVPTLPLPVIGTPPVELPPVPVIGKPPVDLPKLPPVPVITPPVDLPKLPPVPVITPPVVTPPAVKTPPTTPKPGCAPPKKPRHKKAKCPIDTIKLGACLDVLGAVWHVGNPAVKCCPLIEGLASVDAALCLCTAIKAKALGLSVYLPVAVELLVSCGKKIPPGYKCP